MDLVFSFARAHHGAGQWRRCSSRARPRRSPHDPRVRAVYLGEGGAWLSCCASTTCRAGYGEARRARAASLCDRRRAQSLALLGRNGTGKTTLINTLVGVTTRKAGTHPARPARHHPRCVPTQRAAAGIGWVPQERNIFRSLTVEENLTAVARPGPWTVRARLRDVPAPGGAARATWATSCPAASSRCWRSAARWSLNPRLLLLDEPLEGLAPIIVDELLAALRRIAARGGAVGHHRRAERPQDPRHDRRCDHPRPRHRSYGQDRAPRFARTARRSKRISESAGGGLPPRRAFTRSVRNAQETSHEENQAPVPRRHGRQPAAHRSPSRRRASSTRPARSRPRS